MNPQNTGSTTQERDKHEPRGCTNMTYESFSLNQNMELEMKLTNSLSSLNNILIL